MPLKFKEETVQFKFVWDEGGEEECPFVCRQPSPRDFTRITDANTTYEWDSPPGTKRQRMQGQQRFSKINHEGFMDDKVDFLIVAWGVQDDEGNAIPCTRENKIMFDKARPDVTKWLFEKLDDLADDEKEEKEEDEGK